MSSFERKATNGVFFIPAKLGYLWGMEVFIGKFIDCPCLAIFQDEETAKRVGGIKELRQITIGKRGRMRISTSFPDFAGTTGTFVIVNIGSYLEVWHKIEWGSMYEKVRKEEYEAVILKILSLGNKNA